MSDLKDLNEVLDAATKIDKLLRPTIQKPEEKPTEIDNIKILKASITELRKVYEHINNIYDQLRFKALALIAGEVAIASFIFGDPNSRNIPIGADRRIFFFSAIMFLGLAFGILLWVISTVAWQLPHDFTKSDEMLSDKNRNTYLSFLKYMHNDYCEVNDTCNQIVSKKCKKFNWTIYLLAAGVIILMVIKFGGGLK